MALVVLWPMAPPPSPQRVGPAGDQISQASDPDPMERAEGDQNSRPSAAQPMDTSSPDTPGSVSDRFAAYQKSALKLASTLLSMQACQQNQWSHPLSCRSSGCVFRRSSAIWQRISRGNRWPIAHVPHSFDVRAATHANSQC